MGRSLSLLFILISILSINCGKQPNLINPIYIKQETGITPLNIIPVYIDIKFCNSEKKLIKKAIDNWNDALNGYLVLKVVGLEFKETPKAIDDIIKNKSYVILRAYSSDEIIKERDINDNENVIVGLANKLGGNVMHLVMDRLTEKDIMEITMHELGHLLGADHTDEKYLMSIIYNKERYKCVDLFTIKQVAEYWHLPIRRMNYCIYN